MTVLRNTPVSVLEKLADDENSMVRSGVIRNKNTPVAVLEKLTEDKDEYVRQTLAEDHSAQHGNRNIPVSLFEKLSTDKNVIVRLCLAENETTPVSIMKKLAEDEDEEVKAG